MGPNQINTTPTSVANEPIAAPAEALTNKKQKSKGLVFGIVVCMIFAIAGVAFGVYGMVQANNKDNELNNLRTQIKDQNGATATVNTDEIISDDGNTVINGGDAQNDANVRAIVDVMQKVATETSGVGDIKVYDRTSPMVKDQNAKTLLNLEKSYGLYAFSELDNNIDKSTAITGAIEKKLRELGFVDNDDISGPAYLVGGGNFINRDSGIVCNISGGLPFTVGCGHVSWLSNESITLANELSDAYYAVNNTYPFSIGVKNRTVNDSSVSPYQTMKVPVSNAMGLFYRTSPDAKWQFFTATQAVINCSSFNTQDLKNAFAGETCWDDSRNSNSTVQP